MDSLREILQDHAENEIATKIGMIRSYITLIVMSSISIYIGAFRSISNLQKRKNLGERAEIMTVKDAAMFPLSLSCFLVGLFMSMEFLNAFHNSLPNYIKLCLTLFIFCCTIMQFARLLKLFIMKTFPRGYLLHHRLLYERGRQVKLDLRFHTADIITFVICSVFAVKYLVKKHWIASNLLGIAVAVNDIEFWHLNSVINGCVLLGSLLLFDIFWVFGTNVMSNVVLCIEAPVVLIVPSDDVFEYWKTSKHFTMLSLGDVIIPGIFIALLLRFEESFNRGQKLYFYSSLFAYILGLVATIVCSLVFQRGQPGMLYIVPACIVIPGAIALIKGDITALLQYRDYPVEQED